MGGCGVCGAGRESIFFFIFVFLSELIYIVSAICDLKHNPPPKVCACGDYDLHPYQIVGGASATEKFVRPSYFLSGEEYRLCLVSKLYGHWQK